MKKIIAAVLSLCIVGGSLPAAYSSGHEYAVTAFALTDEQNIEFDTVVSLEEEYTAGSLTYRIYNNRAELIECDQSAKGAIIIPDKVKGAAVKSIGENAFANCSNVTSVTIPDSVTSIGAYAFAWCSSITSITMPDSVTSIGKYAFAWCSSLTSITIPDQVTSINDCTFYICRSIKTITVPDHIKSIGGYAFSNCESLTSITIMNPSCKINDTNTTICNSGDRNAPVYYNGTIRGYDNSAAQQYAEKCGYKFVSLGAFPKYKNLGKVNDDDKITVADAAEVLKECASLSKNIRTFSDEQKLNADLDFTGKITVTDASLILRYCAYLAKRPKDVMDCKTWLASINIIPDEEKK